MLTKFNALFKDKNTLVRWMTSYALILMASILIIFLICLGTISVVDDMIIDLNDTMLVNNKQALDNKLIEAKKLALQISFTSNISEMKVNSYEELEEKWTDLAKLATIFSNYKVSNGFVQDFYIYIRNTDVILTPNGTSRCQYFYDEMHKSPLLSSEQWVEMLNTTTTYQYTALPAKSKNSTIDEYITYIAPLSNDVAGEPYAVLVIIIAPSESLSTHKSDSDSFFFIIDSNDLIIAGTKKSMITDEVSYSDFSVGSGQISKKIGGKDIMFSYIASDMSSWKYVNAVPKSTFWGKTHSITRITSVFAVGFLLLGVFLIFIITKRNYTPLENILKRVNSPHTDDKNEFDLISDAITSIEKENKLMTEKLEKQSKVLQQSFLVRFIKGDIMAADISDTIQNIGFSSKNFCVVLFLVEDYSKMFDGIKKDADIKSINLIYYAMQNVIEELSNIKHNGTICEMDGMIVCLVNLNSSMDNRSDIMNITKSAKEFIENELYVRLTVSIGSFEVGVDNINTSYKNALLAMEHRVLNKTGEIIEYDTLPKAAIEERSPYTLNTEYRFLNCVKALDLKQAETILLEIMDEVFSAPMPISLVRCLIFDIVSTMKKAIDELTLIYGIEFMQNLNPIDNMVECKTINELKDEIVLVLECANEYADTHKKQRNNDLRENIVNYVRENYGDASMSVASIADVFGVDLRYLSKFFKYQTGEGLLDFIHKTRIENAKLLLENKKYSINDVAIAAGFADSAAFIRVFKKREGITPGKYREGVGSC